MQISIDRQFYVDAFIFALCFRPNLSGMHLHMYKKLRTISSIFCYSNYEMEKAPIHLELACIKMFVVPVGSFSNIPHRARYTPYHKQAWHMNEVLKSESVCGYLLRQAECRGILSAGRVSIDSTFLFIA